MTNRHPLRTSEERLTFCDRYFQAVGADVICERPMYREYILPVDVDKELTDRPFYWMWVEKTNQTVEPTTLRLAFDQDAKLREDERLAELHQQALAQAQPLSGFDILYRRPKQTELVDLGSFRLDKIIESARRRGQTVCVVPHGAHPHAQYIPWLMINGLTRYVTDSVSETWWSKGVCLANLQIVESFYDRIAHLEMAGTSPEVIVRQAKHSLLEAAEALQAYLSHLVAEGDLNWAEEARLRLADDLAQLDAYYQSIEVEYPPEERNVLQQEHAKKRQALIEKSTPGSKSK
ncbi:YqhG family protein [Alicyclobacillus sacchari]|uniref:YqhG family protein n=1 Tax=Alicyclobacillus sacchari TaxID=392010 RepID=UPI0024E108C8|nr:YqhG family protein [Alicyclobacillus sacchari]